MDAERSPVHLTADDIEELEARLYLEAALEDLPYTSAIEAKEELQHVPNIENKCSVASSPLPSVITIAQVNENECTIVASTEVEKVNNNINADNNKTNINNTNNNDNTKNINTNNNKTNINNTNNNDNINNDKTKNINNDNHNNKNECTIVASTDFTKFTMEDVARIVTTNDSNTPVSEKRKKRNKRKSNAKKNTEEKIILEIVLSDSDNDVIILPTQASPILTIDDSCDEHETKVEADANKIPLVDNPCLETNSNLSTDDFLENEDRRRLKLADANDEDLLSLISHLDDIKSISTKDKPKNPAYNAKDLINENLSLAFESVVVVGDKSPEEVEKPSTSNKKAQITNTVSLGAEKTYDYRAIDVYDESSDADTSRRTHPRVAEPPIVVPTNNNEDDDSDTDASWNAKFRVKRTRRIPRQEKIDLTHNFNHVEDSNENDVTKNLDGSSITQVPFIGVGPALTATKNSNSTNSDIISPQRRRRRMSDKKFIDTLNNLAQNPKTNTVIASSDDDDDGDNNNEGNLPTARDIAEKVIVREEQERELKKNKATTENDIRKKRKIVRDELPVTPSMPSALGDPGFMGKLRHLFEYIDDGDKESVDSYDNNISDDNMIEEQPAPKINENAPRTFKYNTTDGEKLGTDGPGWTYEMCTFYNKSWSIKNMRLADMINKMSRNKSHWRISNADYYPQGSRRQSNVKCFNCLEFGHTQANCSNARKSVACCICGERGHMVGNCPNAICLNCGQKTNVFMDVCTNCRRNKFCGNCLLDGHSMEMCPDQWRRYHSTVSREDDPVIPKPTNIEWRTACCVCASNHHLAEDCRYAKRHSHHQKVKTNIISYRAVYEPQSPTSGIDLNLLYDPYDKPQFRMAQNTKEDKYYGRFLKSANLLELMKQPTMDAANKPQTPEAPDFLALDSDSNYSFSESFPNTNNDNGKDNNTKTKQKDNDKKDDYLPLKRNRKQFIAGEDFIPLSTANHADEDESNNVSQNIGISKKYQEHIDGINDDSAPNLTIDEKPTVAKMVLNANDKKDDYLPLKRNRKQFIAGEDFIPLSTANHADEDESNNVSQNIGISKKYQEHIDGINDDSAPNLTIDEKPTVAKMFLNAENSNFLLSTDGQKFLDHQCAQCDIKTHINLTSIGHVLHITGTSQQQDIFHNALQKHLSSVMMANRYKECVILNIPKNVQAMISHIRSCIHQLFTKIGNVSDLHEVAKLANSKPSKANTRASDRARRSLNMILIGQAGLNNGKEYIRRLLTHFRDLQLINDSTQSKTKVDGEMRKDIYEINKMVFSPHRHDNYEHLIRSYLALEHKHYLRQFNVNAVILCQSVININQLLEKMLIKDQETLLNSEPQDEQSSQLIDNLSVQTIPREEMTKLTETNDKHNISDEEEEQSAPQAKQRKLSQNHHSISAQLEDIMKRKNQQQQEQQQPPYQERQRGQQQQLQPPYQERQRRQPQQQQHPPYQERQREQQQGKWSSQTKNMSVGQIISNYNKYNKSVKPTPSPGQLNQRSEFWSKESVAYIKPCLPKTVHDVELHRLVLRVLQKAKEGCLSYHDYRGVIKLHNTVMNNNQTQ